MKKILLALIVILILDSFIQQEKTLFLGKENSYEVIIDSNRAMLVVEIKGVKYGHYDYLKKTYRKEKDKLVIGESVVGSFYFSKNKLFYRNLKLSKLFELKKTSFTRDIDDKRYKIFQIVAFNKTSHIKDSLNIKDFNFDWNVRPDYNYFISDSASPYHEYLFEKRIFLTK